jgi:two-component system LytT family response regulator
MTQRLLRAHVYGFVYWLAFLLVLEPGNILRASQAGLTLSAGHEAIRILVAALLGTTVTPALLALTAYFPVQGMQRWRHVLIHASGTIGLAFSLVVVSCLLAAWFFEGHCLPTPAQVRGQLVGNFTLLLFALCALSAITHLFPKFVQDSAETVPYLTRVEVKTRGGVSFLELSAVDWIETQGNYLALHAGQDVHLIRDTLVKFESRLDPRRFVRIHRRMMVALDRIDAVQPVANGDAMLQLRHGELRVSRRYRAALRERWRGPA